MSRCATHLINRKDKPTFSRSTRVSKRVSSTSIKYRWLSLSPSPKNSIHLFKKKKDIISCIRTRVEDNFFSKLSNETFSLPHNRWPSFGPNRWAAAPFESHPWLTMFFLFLYTYTLSLGRNVFSKIVREPDVSTDPYLARQLILPSIRIQRFSKRFPCVPLSTPWPKDMSTGKKTTHVLAYTFLCPRDGNDLSRQDTTKEPANDHVSPEQNDRRISISPGDNAPPLITTSCWASDQFSTGGLTYRVFLFY